MTDIKNSIKYRKGLKFAILFTLVYFIIGSIGISIVDLFLNNYREWVFLLLTTIIMFYISLRFIYRDRQQIRLLVNQQLDLKIYQSIFYQMNEGLMITNEKEEIINVNPSFTKTTGYSKEEVLGQKPTMLSSGVHSHEFYQTMWRELRRTGRWQGEVINKRKNGDLFHEQLSIAIIRDHDGALTHYIAVFTDISNERDAESKIKFLTDYDSNTRLAKFDLFMKHLYNYINDGHDNFSLFIIDTAKLKEINATFGHKLGDRLLQTLAIRLQNRYKGYTMGRLNSKEFAIIIPSVYEHEAIDKEIESLFEDIEAAIQYKGHDYFLSATIGVGVFPNHGEKADELYKNATLAKTAAKEIGRKFLIFGDQLLTNIQRKVLLENHLIKAIEKNELELYYQPQIDINNKHIIGVEALLRWNHTTLGMISPDEFIPLAEESGLILPIGDWILEQVCEQISEWYKADIYIPKIAINLSPIQFQDKDLLRKTKQAFNNMDFSPSVIEFEITENYNLFQIDSVLNTIFELRKLGIKISVDDFGKGHSSLSYLQKLPIDHLKVDRSFIMDLPQNKSNIALTKAIIAMAHELNLTVVAEGVESKEQLDFLQGLNCEYAQGYYLSKPLPAKELIKIVKKKNQGTKLYLSQIDF